jgi:hypothetical protein
VNTPKVGGQKIGSANRKSGNFPTNLFRFEELLQMLKFADLQFVDHTIFSQFVDPVFICGLKTSANT